MAQSTLPVLAHPSFPQVFARAIDFEVSRVLGLCDGYETPESSSGACDAVPCKRPATVHHLASEQEFCLKHFKASR